MNKISAPVAAAILAGFDAAANECRNSGPMPIPTAIQAFFHVHGDDVRQLLMDLSEPESGADPAAIDPMTLVERIAEDWDGCTYDAPGQSIDIGDAIRFAGKRLITEESRS
jgi:hypothetical protein